MNVVIDIVTPVLGLGLLGYIAARLGYFSDSATAGLSRFVFDWAVPAFLIRSFITADLPSAFPWQLLVTFYLPAYTIYFGCLFFSMKVFGRDLGGGVITGFSCAFGNSVLLGIPLILLAFGEEGAIPFFILLSFHGLSFFTISTLLLTYNRSKHEEGVSFGSFFKGLYTNPIILGLAIGVIMNRLGWYLPGPIDQMAEYLQFAVTPCALFALGATLTQYRIVGQLPQTVFVVLIKNMVFPLLVWVLATQFFQLPELWTFVAVVMAASPTGVNAYLFADRFNTGKALASTSVFLSTTVSIVTLSTVIYLFTRHSI